MFLLGADDPLQIPNAHSGPILDLATGNDGMVVSGGKDGIVKLWKVDTTKTVIQQIAPSLLNLNDPSIETARRQAMTPGELPGSSRRIHSVSLSTNSDCILLGTNTDEIFVCNAKRGGDVQAGVSSHSITAFVPPESRRVDCLCTHPLDSSRFFSGGSDGVVFDWKWLSSGNGTCASVVVCDSAITAMDISRITGRTLAVGLASGSIELIDLTHPKPVAIGTYSFRKGCISVLKFSATGTFLAVGSADNAVDIFDVGTKVGDFVLLRLLCCVKSVTGTLDASMHGSQRKNCCH